MFVNFGLKAVFTANVARIFKVYTKRFRKKFDFPRATAAPSHLRTSTVSSRRSCGRYDNDWMNDFLAADYSRRIS